MWIDWQLVTDVLGEEMEEIYNEAAAFWQGLKRELAKAIAEKEGFLNNNPGIEEDDLEVSSEEEGDDEDEDGLVAIDDESDTESVTARRR